MAKCECGVEMKTGKGCTVKAIATEFQDIYYNRTPYGSEPGNWGESNCYDCNVAKGEIHHMGCDVERCPICKRQLISCDCEIYWAFEPKQPKIDREEILKHIENGEKAITDATEKMQNNKINDKQRRAYEGYLNMLKGRVKMYQELLTES